MFGVWFLVWGVSVRDAVFRVWGSEFMVVGVWFLVWGEEFMVVGLWFVVWGEEFAAWGCTVWSLWLQGYLAQTKQPPP